MEEHNHMHDTRASKPRKRKASSQSPAMIHLPAEEQKHITNAPVSKPRKMKAPSPYTATDSMKRSSGIRAKGSQKGRKAPKRGVGVTSEVSPSLQADRMPDSSTSGNDYRALRRKYLLLEEESFGLGRELKEVEGDIKTLEEDKLSLLDELVVLEGLIDPLDIDIQSQRQRLQ